ncbi:MAG: hypothetical protein WBI04_05330 [Trichlorobacter sp.]
MNRSGKALVRQNGAVESLLRKVVQRFARIGLFGEITDKEAIAHVLILC